MKEENLECKHREYWQSDICDGFVCNRNGRWKDDCIKYMLGDLHNCEHYEQELDLTNTKGEI